MFQPGAFQSDAFQEGASFVASQIEAAGGWPIYYPRRKRKQIEEPVPSEVTANFDAQAEIEAAAQVLQARRTLRRAEQRDQQVTAQLRAIYAEQDALARDAATQAEMLADEDDVELILAALA